MKWIYKFQKFMYGRYGLDELYKFLFYLYIILLILNIFIKSSILTYVELFIVVVMFYRFFSKNIKMRKKENALYLKCKKNIIKPFKNIKKNITDKEHIYKKCSKCKSILKLPLPEKRGIKHTKCPKCGKRLTIFCFKYEKVEIITNKKVRNN